MLTPERRELNKKIRKQLRKLSDQRLLMRYHWERDYAGGPQGPFLTMVLEEMHRRSH